MNGQVPAQQTRNANVPSHVARATPARDSPPHENRRQSTAFIRHPRACILQLEDFCKGVLVKARQLELIDAKGYGHAGFRQTRVQKRRGSRRRHLITNHQPLSPMIDDQLCPAGAAFQIMLGN